MPSAIRQASISREGLYNRVLSADGNPEFTTIMKAVFWQKHKDTSLNPRQLKVINRLLDTGENFEGPVTTRKYARMTKCSKVTASRDLNDLVEKNILARGSEGGRSTNYELKFKNR